MSQKKMSPRFILAATLLGNTLEWYDFATFGFLIPLFAQLFFPFSDSWSATMNTLIVYSTGTIMRPIGGLIFGFIGDRYGRRNALILSVLLMTLPVLIIGLLPSYLQIGITATIILTIMRMLQGIAGGGEFPGTITFLIESSPPRQQGYFGSFAFFGAVLGMLIGGGDFLVFGDNLMTEKFIQWGWRVIFLIGALVGLISFLMRRRLHETHPFEKLRESHEILKDPVRELFLKYKKKFFQLCGIAVLETVGFNLIIPFSILYLTQVAHLSYAQSLHHNLLRLLVIAATIPLAGKLSTKIGPKKFATVTSLGFILFSIPLYWLMKFEHMFHIASCGLAILQGCYMAPVSANICSLLPARVRFSGIGIGYNLTIGLVGAICPIAALSIIHSYQIYLIPAYILMGAAAISLFTLRSVPEKESEHHH